jgi:hypothetical protein
MRVDERYQREVIIWVKTRELVFQGTKDSIHERRADINHSGG